MSDYIIVLFRCLFLYNLIIMMETTIPITGMIITHYTDLAYARYYNVTCSSRSYM